MRFITAVTTFLAVGFASASPAPAVGADVQANAARAESGLSDILSQTKEIKSLVQTDLDKSPELSATELDDITERIERLVDGLVPLDLDFLTGGDLDDLGGIVSNISNIIGSLIKGVPLFSLNTRNLDLSPIFGAGYKLIGALSKLLNGVLPLVYRAAASSAGRENPEVSNKLVSDAGALLPSLTGIIKSLGN